MGKTPGKRKGKEGTGVSRAPIVPEKAYATRSDSSGSRPLDEATRCPPRWVLIAWAALIIFGVALGFRQISSPDLGWHLSYAHWIVDNAAVPTVDPLTHTVPDRSATNPQWLFQLIVLAIMSIAGTAGIVVVSTLLSLAFAALLLLRTWHRLGRVPLVVIPLVALFFLGQTWQMRPHVFSCLLGAVTLLILERSAAGQRRWLWFLPLVMLLWVNVHALFILGLVAIATYVFADVAVSLWRRKRFDRRLMIVGGVSLLCCLINPYHVHTLLLPFAQFGDIQAGSVFKSETIGTAEFLSPFRFSSYVSDDGRFALFIPYLYWQLYALLAILGMVFAAGRARLAEWLLFLGFFYLFYSANKNFGYFVMATFPVTAVGLDNLVRAVSARWGLLNSTGPRPAIAWTAGLLVCIGLGASGWFFHAAWSDDRHGMEFNRRTLPIEAAGFISEHDLQGNLLNTWNDGGYLAYATRQPVFIYGRGRVMGPDFYARYKRSREEPTTFVSLLREHQPTIAVFNPNDASLWFGLLLQRPDWRLVHRDPHYVVFLHDSLEAEITEYRPDDPPQVDPDALPQRVTEVTRLGGMSVIQWLQGGAVYPRSAIDDATFYLNFGRPNAAIAAALNGLEQADYAVPDLFLRLTEALYLTRRVRLGDQTFEAFTRADPNVEPQIRNALRRLRERAVR